MNNDMRDRLIELIQDIKSCNPTNWDKPEFMALALLANGVILPPCNEGNTVYWVLEDFGGRYVSEDTVTEVGAKGFWVSQVPAENGIDDFTPWEEIGKTVFLTREEAEKALKEMGK